MLIIPLLPASVTIEAGSVETQVRILPRPLNTGLTVNRRLGFLEVSVVQSQS